MSRMPQESPQTEIELFTSLLAVARYAEVDEDIVDSLAAARQLVERMDKKPPEVS